MEVGQIGYKLKAAGVVQTKGIYGHYVGYVMDPIEGKMKFCSDSYVADADTNNWKELQNVQREMFDESVHLLLYKFEGGDDRLEKLNSTLRKEFLNSKLFRDRQDLRDGLLQSE